MLTFTQNHTETKKIRAWGNGLGVLLPKELIEKFHLQKGDTLSFSFENEKVTISPLEEKLEIPNFSLEQLLQGTTKEDFLSYDWDSKPLGREEF